MASPGGGEAPAHGGEAVRYRFPGPLVPARLVRRANRFAAEVRRAGGRRPVRVHLPNSGRMTELLVPGVPVRVMAAGVGARSGRAAARAGGGRAPGGRPGRGARRTAGTLVLVRHRGRWVGVDSRVPNRLVEAAFERGGLPPITGIRRVLREVRVGRSRLDFVVEAAGGRWLVEAKSCNKVVAGVALFPDAPTARGTRHLRALAARARRGQRVAVLWVVQRDDARCLRPDAAADPAFAAAVAAAAAAGVELAAYSCRVGPGGIVLDRRIPVLTSPRGRALREAGPPAGPRGERHPPAAPRTGAVRRASLPARSGWRRPGRGPHLPGRAPASG